MYSQFSFVYIRWTSSAQVPGQSTLCYVKSPSFSHQVSPVFCGRFPCFRLLRNHHEASFVLLHRDQPAPIICSKYNYAAVAKLDVHREHQLRSSAIPMCSFQVRSSPRSSAPFTCNTYVQFPSSISTAVISSVHLQYLCAVSKFDLHRDHQLRPPAVPMYSFQV